MKKIALLFSGQGSQYCGMGKSLYNEYSHAREIYEEASEALGFDLYKLCLEGGLEEITRTENAQPAILTNSYISYKYFEKEFGVEPAFLAGHSLGEISALTCAGAISFGDAVKIVRKRGELMRDSVVENESSMLAIIGISKTYVEDLCHEVNSENNIVVISNYNSPEQVVVSGTKNAVDILREKLPRSAAKVVPLKVSAPFHSPLMKNAADLFAQFLSEFNFYDIKYPILSNVSATLYKSKSEIIENLREQMVKAVQWEKIMNFLKNERVEITVELGPKNVLKNLSIANTNIIEAYAFDKEEDRNELMKKMSANGKSPKMSPMLFVTRCMAHAICTKNSNWDDDEYQRGVVEPYKRVKEMQKAIEEQGKEPTIEQMSEALNMLSSVFITKKVSEDEQKMRFNSLLDETGTRHLFSDFKML